VKVQLAFSFYLYDRFFFFPRFRFDLAEDDFNVFRRIVLDDFGEADCVNMVFNTEIVWVEQPASVASNANHTSLKISSFSFFLAQGFNAKSLFRLGTGIFVFTRIIQATSLT